MRRIRIFRRSDVPFQAQWFPSPNGIESVGVVSSGVNIVIDGLGEVDSGMGVFTIGSVDISTDRAVVWTQGLEIGQEGGTLQPHDMPLEIYMEGNIVFRLGDRIIYADQMYYDVRRQIGVILNAELQSPVPGFEGVARLKAQIIRQLDRNRFLASDALLTTSRMGEPGYHFSRRSNHVRGHPTAGGRSGDRPGVSRSLHGRAANRPSIHGHQHEQSAVRRRGAGLLLADDGYRSGEAEFLRG